MKHPKPPTYHMLVVIGSILSSPDSKIHGSQLIESHKFSSGTLYPILRQLTEEGILRAKKEKGRPSKLGRPLHTYYRLTKRGERYGEKYKAAVIAANPPLIPFKEFK